MENLFSTIILSLLLSVGIKSQTQLFEDKTESYVFSRESLQSDIIFSTNISDTTKITRFNINNISTSFTNNGVSDRNFDQFYAFIFHKDLYLETFYWTGFLWAEKLMVK